jgi:pyruvate formate lyase activating enzyme
MTPVTPPFAFAVRRDYNSVVSILADVLAARTRDGSLCEPAAGGKVRCYACAHACAIADGATGVCKVRFNRGGRLRVPWGYIAGSSPDPIEKKPFYHVSPGSIAYSFGMLGCDLHCAYCQNWLSSQTLRDPLAAAGLRDADPDSLVEEALEAGASSVVSTYNEPLITAEWAIEIFGRARAAGLATGFVSNGHGTPQVIDALAPHLDFFKIDLKAFDDARYRQLGGRLQPVLDTIGDLHRRQIWIEIVTLLVPGFNDSAVELRRLTEFLAGISPEIPWHVTAFHPTYRMMDRDWTRPAALAQAADIGRQAGLQFVYAGNLPGRVGSLEDTRCPACRALLVERAGFRTVAARVTTDGCCPDCGTSIPGRWHLGPGA